MLVTAPLLATTKPTPNAGSCTSACRSPITTSPVQPHLTLLLHTCAAPQPAATQSHSSSPPHTCSCTSARRNNTIADPPAIPAAACSRLAAKRLLPPPRVAAAQYLRTLAAAAASLTLATVPAHLRSLLCLAGRRPRLTAAPPIAAARSHSPRSRTPAHRSTPASASLPSNHT